MENANMVKWERQGEIGILSLSNGKENYIGTPDFIAIDDLKQWVSERGLKGVIITGRGRNFSAGADLKNLNELAKNQDLLSSKMNKGKEILDFIEGLNIPVIAAVNGVCFGGGMEIALAAHIRIASKNALFAFPEANHGLMPGLGGTHRLTKILGKRAFELVLKGDMINAPEAKGLGLVNYIVESKNAMEFAVEFLEKIISGRSIDVIHSVMQAIKNSQQMERNDALKAETELFCNLAVNVKVQHEE